MSFCLRATAFLLLTSLLPARFVYAGPTTLSKATLSPQQTVTADSLPPASIRAFASTTGVLIQWSAVPERPTLGFNLFRISSGQIAQLNSSLIAGSALTAGDQSQTYSWLDQSGALSSRYYVESVDLYGKSVKSEMAAPSWLTALPSFQPSVLLSNLGRQARTETTKPVWTNDGQGKSDSAVATDSAPQNLANQWSIANRSALKIGVRADGWYRITQAQLAAAGFDTSGDARNLRLFVGGNEVAINVSRDQGSLGASDFIEFWGQGIDTPSSDTQVYWLINDTQAGLRIAVMGDVTTDAPPSQILPATAAPAGRPTENSTFIGFPIVLAETIELTVRDKSKHAQNQPSIAQPEANVIPTTEAPKYEPAQTNSDSEKLAAPAPVSPVAPISTIAKAPAVIDRKTPTPAKSTRRTARNTTLRSRKSRRHRSSQRSGHRRHHAALTVAATPSFVYSVEHDERNIYYPAALNGVRENFFGPIVGSSGTSVTIPLHGVNPDLSAQAQVQVALQGVSFVNHQVKILVNNSMAGLISFTDENSNVQTFSIPASTLIEGNNIISLTPVHPDLCATAPNDPRCSDVSVAEYVRVTYPHVFVAESNSLQFSIKSNQSARVDGFSTANLRVLDVSNPNAIQEVRPILETSGGGFAATIPGGVNGKARRIVALPADRLSQPAWLTMNQPSSLNSSSNAANLVIISYKDFLSALDPLVAQRTAQGYKVTKVDIEDVFDEFSYGVHSPQAIKDFMSQARSWSQPPAYLLLVGDATYDPRNYMGFGNLDFVPTKQIDTGIAGTDTAIETASDDWFTDLNGDGIGDISVGRLPVRTLSDANLVVSKIVNYSPSNSGNRALLIADTQGSYYFDFETADDKLGALLPATMTVQKIYRRLQPSDAVATANIIASLNSGQSVTVYSGHGNINIWGGSIFTSSDAAALNNGNRLSFVVVMDCLNGYFDHPTTQSLAEAFLTAANGGAVASFASSGLTIPDGQHDMGLQMFQLLYSGSPMAIGDASRLAKAATSDMDVRRTWILFGDPTLKIR